MTRAIDLTGLKFSRLTVIAKVPRPASTRVTQAMWRCMCDCGREKDVLSYALRKGTVKSCGCLKADQKTRLSHGLRRTAEYRIWGHIKSRCFNERCPAYLLYGGRGITVCSEWANSFETFYSDMGKRPGPNFSIDRVDTNGTYSRENCRWALPVEQVRNRRSTLHLEGYPLAHLAEELGMSYHRAYYLLITAPSKGINSEASREARRRLEALLQELSPREQETVKELLEC